MTTTPLPIVKGVETYDERLKHDYRKGVLPFKEDEIADFETEATKYLNGEWREDQFIMYRLVRGVYGQRQADVQMMRVKIPAGALTANQLDAFGEVVTKYAPLKKGHITTRENIQIHFLKLADTPAVMRILGAAGLVSREACGNVVRNVAGDPMAGIDPAEPFPVTPYLAAFARWFLRHEQAQVLPRKMKCAFTTGGSIDSVVADIHDLAYIPKVRTGADGKEERGFEIRAGGGTSIMPRIALTLYDFVSVDEYLRVSEAVIRVFNHTDELRKNRMRARIKFYIDRIGIDAFRKEVEEELEGDWAKADFSPEPLMELPPELEEDPPALVPDTVEHTDPDFLAWRGSNVFAQSQTGYNGVYVTLPLGDILEHQFAGLSKIARNFAGGRLRTTAEQNLIYRWVPDGYLFDVWSELKSIGLAEDGANQVTDVVACPGTDSCKMGITSSMGVAAALRTAIREFGVDDPLIRSLHVKVSGCPNGCARHHIANIGLHGAAMKGDGNQIPAYELFLAGNYGSEDAVRFGHRVKAKVPAKRVPEMIKAVLGYYQSARTDGEKFNDFVDRVGTEPFEEMLGQYRDIGKLNKANLDTYMDWSKTILYKLERGEGECAV